MRTIVYIAHPDSAQSSSQQFLLSSGQSLTDATFVDLQQEFEQNGAFDAVAEQARLSQYQRIIFQFPLYWYQAPAILKQWIDTVFDMSATMQAVTTHLAQCQLGIVLVVGVKANEYQSGGREHNTLSELLSPYEALARFFQMQYLAPLVVSQFQYMSEPAQQDLMLRYGAYLQLGTAEQFDTFQTYIIEKLQRLTRTQLSLSPEDEILFEAFVDELVNQQEELAELNQMTRDW